MYFLYSTLLAILMGLATPFWFWQMLRHGKYRRGFGERWGKVPGRIAKAACPQAIWVHAVSVGEVLAVSGLIEKLKTQFPDDRIVVSTTTDTGQKLARERFGEEDVFYFPLDFAFAIRPYLQTLKPRLVILAETEFWPNFLRLARSSGARIAVVNGRISDRSWPGYKRFSFLFGGVLKNVDLFLAQSEEDRRRLVDIGAPNGRVRVTGNLKFDAPDPLVPALLGQLKTVLIRENIGPVIVCGSTVEGEEALLAPLFRKVFEQRPRSLVLLAPRHPERFDSVSSLLEQEKLTFVRRSQWSGSGLSGSVFLLDTIGELSALYALASVALVGGSLVARGGHNILEPARYGAAIIVGEHTENFRDIVGLFRKSNALVVTNPTRLREDLLELVANEPKRIALGKQAAEVLRTQAGATERTLSALKELMN